MKYNNMLAFEKHLDAASPNSFADVYAIIGKDDFDRSSALNKITKTIGDDGSYNVFEGSNLNLSRLEDLLYGMSLFAQKSTIVIQDVDKLKKDAVKLLENYLLQPNPLINLIFVGTKFNKTTRLYKQTEKVGVIMDFVDLKPWERDRVLTQWLMMMSAKYDKTIKPEACHSLLQGAEVDKFMLMHELEKLVCFVGERNVITNQDVAKVSSVVHLDTIWKLRDAIWLRNQSQTMCVVRNMGEEVLLVLLAQLRKQFQMGLLICSTLQTTGNLQDVVSSYPYLRGKILENVVYMARQYGLKRFKKALLIISETETTNKNSDLEDEILLETLVYKLVSL